MDARTMNYLCEQSFAPKYQTVADKETFIVSQQEVPFYALVPLMRLVGVRRAFDEDIMNAYLLGVIHGKREERRRRS